MYIYLAIVPYKLHAMARVDGRRAEIAFLNALQIGKGVEQA
jgi:hypothetical protein